MSHSPQSNIDDIVKLLENAVNNTGEEPVLEDVESAKQALSYEQIQNELKKRYLTGTEEELAAEEDEYSLDDAFLREVNAVAEPKKTKARSSTTRKKNAPVTEDVALEEDRVDTAVATQEVQTAETFAPSETSQTEVTEDDRAPWEDALPEEEEIAEIVAETEAEEIEEVEEIGEIEKIEEIEEIESVVATEETARVEDESGDLLELLQSAIDEMPKTSDATELEEISDVIEQTPILLDDVALAPELQEEEEEAFPLEEPIMEPLSIPDLEETESEESLANDTEEGEAVSEERNEIDPSLVDLLLQFGCREELEEELPKESVESYFANDSDTPVANAEASYAYGGQEYTSARQTGEIEARYHKKFVTSLLQLIGVGILCAAVLLYDLLPLFSVEFFGIMDYHAYPVAYVFIGLQLLLVCMLPVIGKMWKGIVSFFRFRWGLYTMAAASVLTVFLYDLTLLFLTERTLPPVFHFVAALTVFAATLSDHLLFCRERCAFSVYCGDATAYTLLADEGKHSVAEKMYRGGLPLSQKLKKPAEVDFPNGYFHEVCREDRPGVLLLWVVMPAFVLSVLCGIGCIAIGNDIFASLSAIFVALLAALPTVAFLLDSIVLYTAAHRLAKKECAVAGKGGFAHFAKSDVLVFRDRHLFSACRPNDVGIVFYDKKHTLSTLGCLHALYSEIGGPMANVFAAVPQEYVPNDVKLIRAFRNGIECVVDKKHVLIVGEPRFMERYGWIFPEDESASVAKIGRKTLCVSLDGKMTAKLTVRYTLEPIFEVLVERLAEERVYCAVETLDPLINSSLVAACRQRGHTPVNIVHKTARDHAHAENDSAYQKSHVGMLVRRSRLKLAETVIWCRRVSSIRQKIAWCSVFAGAISFALMVAFLLLDFRALANQYVLLLCQAITSGAILTMSLLSLPRKDHFSLRAYDEKHQKEISQVNKKDEDHE